jgi:MtfA peptidase
MIFNYVAPIILLFIVYFSLVRRLGLFGDFRTLGISKTKRMALESFFEKNIHYYGQLNASDKKKFIARAFQLSKTLRIDGRSNFKITPEVRLLVATAYVQLTFGIENFILPGFQRFIIYPESYINPFTGRLHDGEVNPRGVIVLSWKQLVKGYANPNDKINLGLHEMAHAFFHTVKSRKRQNNFGSDSINKFSIVALEEINAIKSSDNHLLRKYASTNVSEFFAVAVEHFFEAPDELKSMLPKVYSSLSAILNQDPANKRFSI